MRGWKAIRASDSLCDGIFALLRTFSFALRLSIWLCVARTVKKYYSTAPYRCVFKSSNELFKLFILLSWLSKFSKQKTFSFLHKHHSSVFNYCNSFASIYSNFDVSHWFLHFSSVHKYLSSRHDRENPFHLRKSQNVKARSFFRRKKLFFSGEVKNTLRNRTNVECWMKWVCWMGKHKKKHNNFLLFFFSHSAIIAYMCRGHDIQAYPDRCGCGCAIVFFVVHSNIKREVERLIHGFFFVFV